MENENTGTTQLVTEARSASGATEELLPPSPPGDKNSTKKGLQNASNEEKSDAASTIAGAMLICKRYGIKVDYANTNGKLLLIIHGVQALPQPNGKLAFQYVGA